MSDETNASRLPSTQEEMDAVIEREKGKAKRAALKEIAEKYGDLDALKAAAEKAATATSPDSPDVQALITEALAADRKERDSASNARLISEAAKRLAKESGASSVKAALRLADLSEVGMTDDGEPDEAAIREAIDAVKAEAPGLFSTGPSTPTASDAGIGAGGGAAPGSDPRAAFTAWLAGAN